MRNRRWIHRALAAIGVPLLALLLLEGGLRLVGYGESRDYIREVDVAGETHLRDNPAFFDLFFPSHLRPVQLPFSLTKEKPDDVVRVVLLGGSAAMGIPEAAYGMGPVLEQLLQHRHSGVRVEVINLANTAINSHVVREIADGALALDPDAYVVYLGNNEVVGPYGAGTVFTPVSPPLPAIRASVELGRTRVGQLVAGIWRGLSPREIPTRWRGLEMFLDQQVPADHPRLERVRANFRANLEAICEVAAGQDVPVVLATVGVNLRHCAPFASESVDGVEVPLAEATRLRQEQDYAGAREILDGVVERAPDHADAHYRRGRVALAQGDLETAREDLLRARELDTLRFRADAQINAIIEEVARGGADGGVFFADVAESLSQASAFGLPGRELFFEHVHLDLTGNHRAALALMPAVEQAVAARRAGGFAVDALAEPARLSVEACAQSLAYTPWTRARLLNRILDLLERPPFTAQSDHEEQMARLRADLQGLARRMAGVELESFWPIYQSSMRRQPHEWMHRYQAARYLQEGLGEAERAEPLWRDVVAELPHFTAALNSLAECVAQQGRPREARELLERSLELQWAQPEMLWNLSRTLMDLGFEREARRRLEQLLRLEPAHAGATNLLRRLEQE